jgi:nicotinate-nucleotide adenylyltransferase
MLLYLMLISLFANLPDCSRDQIAISVVPFGRVETLNYHRHSATVRRVGVFGGTFDPVHYGHLVVAEEVYAALHLAEMVFVPARQPPHKTREVITATEHRLAMLELAIASNPHFTISRVDLDRAGPSYTVDTLRLLRKRWGEKVAIYFVIGGDSLEDLLSWHDPTGVLEQLTYLVAVRRPGYNESEAYNDWLEARLPGIKQRLLVVETPRFGISATELRLRVAQGRPIKYQTPESVESYITQHDLYRRKLAESEREETHDTHAS